MNYEEPLQPSCLGGRYIGLKDRASTNLNTNIGFIDRATNSVKMNIGFKDRATENIKNNIGFMNKTTPIHRRAAGLPTDPGPVMHILVWRDCEEPLQPSCLGKTKKATFCKDLQGIWASKATDSGFNHFVTSH